MFEYISGRLIEKNPTYAVIDVNGVGYFLNISLNTFTRLGQEEKCKLYTYLSIKEDAHTLYGFIDAEERRVFQLLISVSGIGTNTARLILSSLNASEVQQAIMTGTVRLFENIKGIGNKTAQRIILDLKDKIKKDSDSGLSSLLTSVNNNFREEALSALLTLGFVRNAAEKALDQILKRGNSDSVESLIKEALKML